MAAAYATSAPLAGGGMSNSPPICQNCETSTTPLWRRDESGSVLCNACGLFFKLHGRPRPISLKTDIIKSRNRVKTQSPGQKRKSGNGQSLAAAHPDIAHGPHAGSLRRASQIQNAGDNAESPFSRTHTPNGMSQHASNIAPQHMFDGVTIDGQTFQPSTQSPSLQPFNLARHQSPGAASSANGSQLEPPQTYEALLMANTSLKTRVSELEVINDLFRGRVSELEQSEQAARTSEQQAQETEDSLRRKVEEVLQREAELRKRVEVLEAEFGDDAPGKKRMRMSDFLDESRAGTPASNSGGSAKNVAS